MTTTYLPETQRDRRGHAFYPEDWEDAIPDLFATEKADAHQKVIQVHYFTAGCDWWIAELGRGEEAGRAFGYCSLGDPGNAEWGYVALPELEQLRVANGLIIVERDLHWTPTPFGEIRNPSLAHLGQS